MAKIIHSYCNGNRNEREPSPADGEQVEPEAKQEEPAEKASEPDVKTSVAIEDQAEIENFDNEFEKMMQESATDARKGVNINQ